jgi:hypothetical protein
MPKIHTNGIELYYELHGVETTPLLVLNNGILMSTTTSWVVPDQDVSTTLPHLELSDRKEYSS